eukprot:3526509-Pyramimonas_sp.AAC.1
MAAPAPAEAVRRAEGAWKDAKLKFDQATAQTSRCRDNLVRAEVKEAEALRNLALAEISKRSAAAALAQEVGLSTQTDAKAQEQQQHMQDPP